VDEASMKQKIAEHWNARAPKLHLGPHVAKTADEEVAWDAVFTRHLAPPPGRVLDIGTGHGYLANVACRLGYEAAGVDIAESMVDEARKRASSLGQQIDFRVTDADVLPYEDASFVGVTERNVLWTMPNPERSLREFWRVLEPGGRLLVIESKWLVERTDPVETALGGVPNLDEHYREFRNDLPLMGGAFADEIAALLSACGFVDIEIDPLDEVHAARAAEGAAGSTLDRERRQYLVRASRPVSG
jgi:ubiquinone/menaquinone biosynthesis C-methylase UbiE